MTKGRILQLDGLRGIAILAVFVHHAFHVKLLWMGVDLFFVLSGFLITGILLKSKRRRFAPYIKAFYARRVRRILPAYVIALFVSSLLFGFAWLHYWYLFLGGMNLVLPMGLGELTPIPLWSLAVEEQFYLLWPLAVYFLTRADLLRTAITVVILAPLLRFACTGMFDAHWAIYMSLPFRMDTLGIGALFAIMWPDIKERFSSLWIATTAASLIIVGLISLAVLSRLGYTTDSNTRTGNVLVYEFTLLIVASLFALALSGVGKSFFELKPLLFLAPISYSIYLIHMVILSKIHNALLAIPLILGYACLMWIFVEKPILEWKSKTMAISPQELNI